MDHPWLIQSNRRKAAFLIKPKQNQIKPVEIRFKCFHEMGENNSDRLNKIARKGRKSQEDNKDKVIFALSHVNRGQS